MVDKCDCNQCPDFPMKVRANIFGYERIISFKPGFVCSVDWNGPNSGKSHGQHGMDLLFVLKKDKKAIQFRIYTGWGINDSRRRDDIRPPMAADLGYHSPTPRYKGHIMMTKNCEIIGGKCYYDGSTLRAIDTFKVLLQQGEEALWGVLEKEHRSVFDEG